MNRRSVARSKSTPVRWPLEQLRLVQVTDYTRKRGKVPERTFTADELAVALEFLGRLEYCRRRPDASDALASVTGTLGPLRGLVSLLREVIDEVDFDAQQFLADALEYFTVRLEVASQDPAVRRARYAVELVATGGGA